MKKALNAKRKLGFISSTIPRPDPVADPDQFENWQCVNDIVSTWILNLVSKEIATSLVYVDSAKELCHDLKERFEHGNGPRIFELKRELTNLKQGAMTVSQYFTRIKMLWEELSSYRPMPCNCGDSHSMHDFLQSKYVHYFLMGLDESFAQICAQIMLMEPLPAINKVLSLVVQEERHMSIDVSSSSNQVAFLAKNNQPQQLLHGRGRGQQKKDRPMCSHCGFLGHTVEKYYKIHGFPPGYGRGRGTKPSVHHVAASEVQSTLNLD
ncbi:hypothetical protein AAHE18_19G093000 [Arachis hypogaea]